MPQEAFIRGDGNKVSLGNDYLDIWCGVHEYGSLVERE